MYQYNLIIRWVYSIIFMLYTGVIWAATFTLPSSDTRLVGRLQWFQALPGDTFYSIGRRYDIGYYELVEANPGINPTRIIPGTIIVIPTLHILPATKLRHGLVINLAELRIYYYPEHSNYVITYPVGIGREGWNTPLGPSRIIQKIKNPTWYVPASIRDARAKEGVYLPKSVPPGPDNPLGNYAMRLQQSTYLIHGTNDYHGVGRRSSSGCIRMLPEDVESLFSEVRVGTPVAIVDQPYKLGFSEGKLYFEAHVPLQEDARHIHFSEVKRDVLTAVSGTAISVNWQRLHKIAERQTGIPQVIGQ